ncbi:hypothetical protein K461DRAFT_276044 [Myriangium duriaei CBS 260.36]|uniref:Fatty acid hydroxylase domain-containing protein n=1 Tax=Myriangium duriaei CBS 260.36 TaxID=1168546 RepID=A0A9P4J3R0_9PEZI|nr:hypothetical protein K461DRAFT_276044 [Myriangium duriaei CBS 260.36]
MSLSTSIQQLRDSALVNIDKILGRSPPSWADSAWKTFGRSPPTWTDSVWKTYGVAMSQVGFLFSLPVTVLSFLAIPFFGSTGTSLNLVFFYLTWTAFIWTHSPRVIEIYGTLAVRILCFLLPSLVFLAFDYFLPGAAVSIKAGGRRQLPARLGQRKLVHVAAWSTFNVLLGVFISVVIEMLFTTLFGFRTTLRVTMAIPLPWTMALELLKAFAVRGVLHYVIHRYILHGSRQTGPFSKWHKEWAHSNKFIFSLAAAYDHPACYLLAHWLPSYVPAVFWRMHVLTWLAFQVLVSLEMLFVYSGYSALPSAIILPGMARRVDAHYASGGKGNFGHTGIMDLAFRSGCGGASDIAEDLQDEADRHQVRRRLGDALDDAGDYLDDATDKVRRRRRQKPAGDSDDDAAEGAEKSEGNGLLSKRRTRRG